MPVNEKGIYAGVSVRPVAVWQFNAYADLFQFPWLKYRVNAPSKGYDYLIQASYQPNKLFTMYVRYRNKNKPVDSSGNGIIDYPVSQVRQSLRLNLSQQLSALLVVNSRMELVWNNHQTKNKSEGFLGYMEGKYDRKKLATIFRLQYFETTNYDSRIYVYESDVLYGFSVPAFYDKGLRYCFNIHYRLTRNFECWLRWSQTIYTDQKTLGSGLDETASNRRSEIKVQIQFVF